MSQASIVTDEQDQDSVTEEQTISQEDQSIDDGSDTHDVDDESHELPVDPRAARIAEIAANRSRERKQEQDGSDVADEDAADSDVDYEKAPDNESVSEPPGNVGSAPDEQMVRMKINGQEVERPLSEVIAVAQKQESADVRLNDAAQRNKQLDQREHQLALREQQLNSQFSDQPSEQDAEKRKSLLMSYNQALFDGDEEAAADYLDKALMLGRQPATPYVNPDEIADLAEQRITQRRAEEESLQKVNDYIDDVNDRFTKEYSDIVEDESLYKLAQDHGAKLREQNPNMDLSEVMVQSGNYARNVRDSILGKGNDIRRKRKRGAPSSVSGVNHTQKIGSDPKPAPTRSDVIKNIRNNRPGAR